jgi:hypothetical protein
LTYVVGEQLCFQPQVALEIFLSVQLKSLFSSVMEIKLRQCWCTFRVSSQVALQLYCNKLNFQDLQYSHNLFWISLFAFSWPILFLKFNSLWLNPLAHFWTTGYSCGCISESVCCYPLGIAKEGFHYSSTREELNVYGLILLFLQTPGQ